MGLMVFGSVLRLMRFLVTNHVFFFFGHWGIGEGKEYGTGFKLCPLWIPTLKRATELSCH